MGFSLRSFRQPRLVGITGASAAVILGLAHMAAAGAPLAYLGLNLGALAIGSLALAVSVRVHPAAGRWPGSGILAMGGMLLATSLFGNTVEGASRWVAFGPLFVQPSLLLLPVMVVGFARNRTMLSTAGMIVAALALALQPDRAMSGVLLAGLAALALRRLDRHVGIAFAGAAFAFLVSLARPDTLPAVPYVDRVLYSAFEVHLLAGTAVLAGSATLLAPAFAGWRGNAADRTVSIVFGVVWVAVILAAALGNYPTPVVGYGGSAIIGYLLSVAALPGLMAAPHSQAGGGIAESGEREGAGGPLQPTHDADAALFSPGKPGPDRMARVIWAGRARCGLFALFLSLGTACSSQDRTSETADPSASKQTEWRPDTGGTQVPLWPEGLSIRKPDSGDHPEEVGNGSDEVAGRPWQWASYVTRPTMTIYPPREEGAGTTLLVLPGGGYAAVAMDLEGTEICEWATGEGMTCVVLKYRVPQDWPRNEEGVREPPEVLLALQDAQRAIGLLRQRGSTYGIDPAKIGVIGFSAGAHLAAAVSNAEARTYPKVDEADEHSSRPAFAVVIYTGRLWYTANAPTNLELAPWASVSDKAPPTLLIHAMDDPVNDVRHPMAYALALEEAGVPVDMRIYARGGHAFGLRPTSDPITTQWPEQVEQWLRTIGAL